MLHLSNNQLPCFLIIFKHVLVKFARVSDKLKCMYDEKKGKEAYSTGRLYIRIFRIVVYCESLIDCSVHRVNKQRPLFYSSTDCSRSIPLS